jgi:transketolase
LDLLCVNTIRFLAVDAVQQADSGHPGMPLGAAPMAYVLWAQHLKHNPSHPGWFDRDRFVLSAGHGSMLLYSLLYLTGYDITLADLKRFRQWGGIAAGHPERGLTPGVEVTTGPLGQGCGNAVGLAMTEAHLAARFNRPGFDIIRHFTYGIVSDGDLMEGVSAEAASLAGHLRLGRLILLYDCNRVSLAAATDLTFTEDVAARFEAYGWHVQSVADGNDLSQIHRAIAAAQAEAERPSLIIVRTHIGYGSPHKQDSCAAHGSPLGEEEVGLTKRNLNWPTDPPFFVPDEVLHRFRMALDRGRRLESEWNALFRQYKRHHPEESRLLEQMITGGLPRDWDADLPQFPPDAKGMKTREASGKILNALADRLPMLWGGSADLNPSTLTVLKSKGDFQSPHRLPSDRQGEAGGGWHYAGRNIHFGVREHAMGAILNGIAAHGGTIPFGSTFLVFSDYLRPSLRLACLMELHILYLLTHDSIALGEDGATHQPVEHLASLRAMPHLIVIRPCDANETVEAWRVAVQATRRPVALILTRQNVPTLNRSIYASAAGLRQGAYILCEAKDGHPDLILIGTGSEVSLCLEAQRRLEAEGIRTRVVSMPSWELFEEQPDDYRDRVLPASVKARLAVEAASPLGWHRYVGDSGDVIALHHFGASAPGDVLLREFGFTAENVAARAKKMLDAAREK